tara:strand:- start:146 stop:892 length:747 start_codon:yes stop_codon:yes gene_type:complete
MDSQGELKVNIDRAKSYLHFPYILEYVSNVNLEGDNLWYWTEDLRQMFQDAILGIYSMDIPNESKILALQTISGHIKDQDSYSTIFRDRIRQVEFEQSLFDSQPHIEKFIEKANVTSVEFLNEIERLYKATFTSFVDRYIHILRIQIIDAEDAKRVKRTKPKKEDALALNQNEIMYFFILLGKRNVFDDGENKSHLARGIKQLCNYGHSAKVNEMGITISKDGLKKIEELISDIDEHIKPLIAKGGLK